MTVHKGPLRSGAAESLMASNLTNAALEAAKRLGLSPADTGAVLGVAPTVIPTMRAGKRTVDGYNGEAERADALVRIVKRLGALLGDSETKWRSWIRREHEQLDDTPLGLMKQRDGAQKVAQLLERTQQLQV